MCLQNAFFIKVNEPLQRVCGKQYITSQSDTITVTYSYLLLHITFKSNTLRI